MICHGATDTTLPGHASLGAVTMSSTPDLLLLWVDYHARRILEEHQTGADELGNGFLALGEEGFLAIL